MSDPVIIKWVLDTRPLWPHAKATKDLMTEASRALALLTDEERISVLRYHFVKDAKLALGSALLKRHAISLYCRVHWSSAQFTRDERTKPIFRLADGSQPLLFNLSHQAGLVIFFAVHRPPPGLSIGVDIVCPSERRVRDHEYVTKDGWPRYVDMHDSVFSPGEVQRLKTLPFQEVDKKLSYFYALWCLREAYVKMTGEALLAKWLTELDLRYHAPPGESAPEDRPLEIWFRGAQVEDVEVNMEWYLDDYMLCTAIKGAVGLELKTGETWKLLDIDTVLNAAVKANV